MMLLNKLKSGEISSVKLGAAAIGALAIGAFSVGALAVGAMAIGTVRVGRTFLRKVKISELIINRFRTGQTGRKTWVIPEGFIPESSTGPEPQMLSHETACILNPNKEDANIEIVIYFSDKKPVGPYKVTIPAERTSHIRFNDLTEPEPVPKGTDYASIIKSDIPVIVQHTRLDSRQSENALLTTIAYPGNE